MNEEGVSRFIEEVLHCGSEKDSLKKLSSLKFTHNTPQISYDKTPFPEMKSLQAKSRLQLTKMSSK